MGVCQDENVGESFNSLYTIMNLRTFNTLDWETKIVRLIDNLELLD